MGEAFTEAMYAFLWGLCLIVGIISGFGCIGFPMSLIEALSEKDKYKKSTIRRWITSAIISPFILAPLAASMWALGSFFWRQW